MTDLLNLVLENCTELQQHIISLKYNYGLSWEEMAEVLKNKYPQYATPDKLKWIHGTTMGYLRSTLRFGQKIDATPAQPEVSSLTDRPVV